MTSPRLGPIRRAVGLSSSSRTLALGAGAVALAACADLSVHESKDPALQSRIAAIEAQVRQQPDDVALLIQLGEAQHDANHDFAAADTLRAATDRDPKSAKAHGMLADTYLSLGYVTSAVEHLRQCMGLDRQQPDCLFAVGSLFENDSTQQGMSEARRAYRQLLALAPGHKKAALVQSRLAQLDAKLGPDTGQPEAAASQPATDEAAGQATGANPHAGVPGAPQGELPPGHPTTGQPSGAATTIPGHPTTGPDGQEVGGLNKFGAALKRGYDAVKRSDAVAAEAAFREALAERPDDSAALSGLAQTLLFQKKSEEAITVSEKAVAADPSDPQARWSLGYALIQSGKDVAKGIATWEALTRDSADYAKQINLQGMIDEVKNSAAKLTPKK